MKWANSISSFRTTAGVLGVLLITGLQPACSKPYSVITRYEMLPADFDQSSMPRVQILDSKSLFLRDSQGEDVVELSGITWDHDEQVLYAVSDGGKLYHLAVELAENKIASVKLLKSALLKDKNGKPLKGRHADSEGLSAVNSNNGKRGDAALVISFERRPRIVRYDLSGRYIRPEKIPEQLLSYKIYHNRNKALESVHMHPAYGLVTAAEYPIKQHPSHQHSLFFANGKQWRFKRGVAKNSAVTGIESIGDSGLLVLERAWSGLQNPLEIMLSILHPESCDSDFLCQKETVAEFSSANGWQLDNFEGLASLGNGRYLMVSDNNQKSIQRTVLVLFEIHLNDISLTGISD